MAAVDKSKRLVRADMPPDPRGGLPILAARPSGSPVIWLVALVVAAIALSYGWNVTQINPGALAAGAPKMSRFLPAMIHPDVLTQNQERVRGELDFVGLEKPDPALTPLSAQSTSAPLMFLPDAEQSDQFQPIPDAVPLKLSLKMTPGALAAGQTATVTGSGFAPNSDGVLSWQRFGGAELPRDHFTVDAQGNFSVQFTAPADASQVVGQGVKLFATVSHSVGNVRVSKTFTTILDLIVQTIFMALMATIFGVILSVPLSFLAARNIMSRNPLGNLVYYLTRTFLNLLRSIEVLILAVFFAVWVGLGPFAGMLALTIHAIASLGKLYSEAIESIDQGPIDAITATGAHRLQVIIYAVVPQVIPQLVAFTLYRWDINVRMSTVLGLVGGGGIGFVLVQYINLLQFEQVWAALYMIAIVVIGLDLLSSRVRQALI